MWAPILAATKINGPWFGASICINSRRSDTQDCISWPYAASFPGKLSVGSRSVVAP